MLSTIYEYIPVSKKIPLQTAIQQTITEPVTAVKLLTGGLSDATVFLITTESRDYLLKLIPDHVDKKGLTEKYQLAVGAGVAPGSYYMDDAMGLYITDFVRNQPTHTVFSPTQTVTELSSRIRALHQAGLPADARKTDVTKIFDQTFSWYADNGFLTGTVKENTLLQYEHIKAVYPWNDSAAVFCHNDLNPRNVLCDGQRLWMVDWDTSGVSDRFVDLSIAAIFFAPIGELEASFLHAYFEGDPSAEQLARFKVLKQLCRLVYASKFLQLAMQQQPADTEYNLDPNETDLPTVGQQLRSGSLSMDTPQGLWLYGKAMLNEALTRINEDSFQEYLDCLKQQH
ncbi:phosphotransferase family enzyme [Chitinophaga dinghuensis]|uniref:Phosphotransferase family enzyme n=1 Tax=Chitinophaga dinghuensis TaxID=1539050 RepID=A0A327W787_9BACT|nr:phosphotransferase [Chitinophaga dinghuensis]RAJ81888.1 phosphotransferase family enzyme [Chitinophaga dinghuensis]